MDSCVISALSWRYESGANIQRIDRSQGWESEYLLKEMSAGAVRLAARELFSGEPAREYWKNVGSARLSINDGRALQFLHIIDEEYRNMIETCLPTAPKKEVEHHEGQSGMPRYTPNAAVSTLIPYALSAGAGLLIGRLIFRRR